MKKLLVSLVIIVVVLFSGHTIASEENLKKAGEEALKEEEARLQEIRQDIEQYLKEKVAEDGKTTSEELKVLKRKLKAFDRGKRRADKRLKPYGLTTRIPLYEDLSFAFSGAPCRVKIRKSIAGVIGKDMPVTGRLIWWESVSGGLLILLVSFPCLLWQKKEGSPIAIIFLILCIIGMVLIGYSFFW